MSMDLKNSKNEWCCFSNTGWAFYLNLAVDYGWKEAGTSAPKEWDISHGEWTGVYDWNAGQIVSISDSENLVAALKAYLDDPDRRLKAKALSKEFSENGIPVELDDSDRKFVEEFISFADKNSFEIW